MKNETSLATPRVNSPPKKSGKLVLLLKIVFFVLIIAAVAVLGFLTYKNWRENQKLAADLVRLTALTATPSAYPRVSPTPYPSVSPGEDPEIARLKQQIKELTAQVDRYEKKLNEVFVYSGFFSYLNMTIEKHNGLDGWTSDEFTQGKAMIEKAGDTDFVSMLDWAWNNPQISQSVRLYAVLAKLQDRIHVGLREALNP